MVPNSCTCVKLGKTGRVKHRARFLGQPSCCFCIRNCGTGHLDTRWASSFTGTIFGRNLETNASNEFSFTQAPDQFDTRVSAKLFCSCTARSCTYCRKFVGTNWWLLTEPKDQRIRKLCLLEDVLEGSVAIWKKDTKLSKWHLPVKTHGQILNIWGEDHCLFVICRVQ